MTAKSVIKNPVKLKLLLEFEAALPNEQARQPQEYLMGGSREFILGAAAFFLGFKNQKSEFEDPRKALGMFFRGENKEFVNEINNRIKELERNGKHVQIFTAYSSLKLFEIFFQSEAEEETQTEAEFEVNLFKAILAINSANTAKQQVAFESTEDLDKELRLPMMMFCMSYPVSDTMNFSITELWATQFIKAIYLFEFLDSHSRTKPLLTAFLVHFNCPTWEEYLKRLLPLTIPAIKHEKEAHTDINVEAGEKFEEGCAFIERLMVREEDELVEHDFLSLRAKPFYELSKGVYRIIYGLFVVEKIFKGVYFLLRDINKTLPAAQRISELKSLIGNDFAERVLTYEILKQVYPDKCISFTGKQLDDMHIAGAPDYYIRKGKDILLFESKDFLIPAETKSSFDFAQYENEFEKKLYFTFDQNGNEKPKAVLQLINSIKKLLRNQFEADKDYRYKEVTIYPVLITHDHQYDTGGFNHLINYWFQAELVDLEANGFFIHKIKPLVVVNIDCLIYHQVALRKRLSLHEVLKLYAEHIHMNPAIKFPDQSDAENYLMSKMIPFSVFMDNLFSNKGWKEMPPMLREKGLTLFKNEEQQSAELIPA